MLRERHFQKATGHVGEIPHTGTMYSEKCLLAMASLSSMPWQLRRGPRRPAWAVPVPLPLSAAAILAD
jgi:hypothetical protein